MASRNSTGSGAAGLDEDGTYQSQESEYTEDESSDEEGSDNDFDFAQSHGYADYGDEEGWQDGDWAYAVSYTHLTLPTICSV